MQQAFPVGEYLLFFIFGILLGSAYAFDSLPVYGICAVLCATLFYCATRKNACSLNRIHEHLLVWTTLLLLGATLSSTRWKEVRLPSDTHPHTRTAILLEAPTEKPRTQQVTVRLVERTPNGHTLRRTCQLHLQKDTIHPHPLQAGDTLRFTAQLTSPADKSFFGGADYGQHLLTQHIDGVAYVPLKHQHPNPKNAPTLSPLDQLRIQANRHKTHLLHTLHTLPLTPDEYALTAAMVLGDKSHLNQATRTEYATTGTAHLLALSGMHLSILITLLHPLLLHLPLIRHKAWIGNTLLLLIITTYLLLTGAPLSLQRAACMLALTLFGIPPYQKDHYNTPNLLAISILILLLIDPISLFDLGLQLSVASIIGILLFHRPLTPSIYHPLHTPGNIIAICLGAQLATAPLIAYHFHTLPLYFLLSTLWVTPFSQLLLPLLWLLLLSAGTPTLSTPLIHLLHPLLQLHHTILSTITRIPHATIPLHPKDPAEVLLLYVAILLFYFLLRTPRLTTLFYLICTIITLCITHFITDNFTIPFVCTTFAV